MVNFGQAMEDWLIKVKAMTDLTIDEQAKVTKAGAEAYRDILAETTLREHHTTMTHDNRKHLSDDIIVKATNVDGQKNGVSTVGWEDGMNATIARWLNDGTKKIKGDHFVTNVQNSSEVLEKVFEAERIEYEKIIRKRG